MSVGRRSGISPVTLIVVIILAMISGAIAFAMYTRQVKAKEDLDEVKARRTEMEAQFQEAFRETNETKNTYLKKETWEKKEDLAAAITDYFATHARLKTAGIDVVPMNFRTVIAALEQWVFRLEEMHHEMDKRIAAATLRADEDEAALRYLVADYRNRVAVKNAEADDIQTATTAMENDKRGQQGALTQRKADEEKKYKDAFDKWQDRQGTLLNDIERTTRRNAVVRREIKRLRPEPTVAPPSGRIVRADWRTEKVIINLGEDKVFPGLVFEVYLIDRYGQRVVKGKIEVFKPLVGSSVATIIQTDPENPIVAGDTIQTPFAPFRRHKRFVIAGFIPEDAVYTEEQLKSLIRLNGGQVQNAVDLNTDVLILGQISLTGISEMSKELIPVVEEKAQSGRAEAEKARELGHEIMSWEEFQQSIRR